MNHNNQPDKERQQDQQNPTLDAPGSKVADYGNPTGGSAVDETLQREQENSPRREQPHTQGNETLGNP